MAVQIKYCGEKVQIPQLDSLIHGPLMLHGGLELHTDVVKGSKNNHIFEGIGPYHITSSCLKTTTDCL